MWTVAASGEAMVMFGSARVDLERCARSSRLLSFATVRAVMHNQGLQAVWIYRFGRALQRGWRTWWLWPLLPLLLPAWLVYFKLAVFVRLGYGIKLYLSAEIGPGLYVGHFGGIEVRNCRIGRNCSISQQTSIGEPSVVPGPQIGDNVWIGAHSKIAGPLCIGSGATISAGSRVVRDVPPGALVMGSPARLIVQAYDNRRIL